MSSFRSGTFGSLYYQLVQHQIHELKELNNSIEKLLEQEVARFNAWIENKTKGLDEDRRSEMYEFYSDAHYKYSEMFPTTIRSSLLVSCYSTLETSLLRLCGWLQSERELKVGAKDLKGKGIFQAKEYFIKVLQLPFPDDTEYWKEIVWINQTRNAIVHEDGIANPRNTELMNYIRSHTEYLSLDNSGTIVLTKIFVPHFIDIIRQLFRVLEADSLERTE